MTARGAPLLLLAATAPLCAAALARAPLSGERGRAVYVAKCADCHGRGFEGVDAVPALTGARFAAKWRDRPEALYDKIRRSMPQDDPGILTPAEAADVTALILATNHLSPNARRK
ncbi:cytochrome c [Sphingomonas sp. HITSZ_GF]|uniref:c-type cytochrome n=1 Tax=Sphingomonas sp. HITSZ_GF TaxID=3037247 RepID=UPI00240D0E42|nr:cytochrome c [Sphingomonas sp. HITSZ_GF]MDG2533485.1 cytochrome c [Sphingomonas sp. HITSZ_GF]